MSQYEILVPRLSSEEDTVLTIIDSSFYSVTFGCLHIIYVSQLI